MARRPHSTSPERPAKRMKMDRLTPDDYRNGIFLAPMVRSGALPTRLFALKHGASLVWGPEIVDKAILHAERVVDPDTGIISYNGKSRSIYQCSPVEKPYLIYQIGSADPELAVQAAKVVMHDVSGIDLNCGCPKPFSTHAGMGAALLSTPDLLCSILRALREAMPPEIAVSCKIRLLSTQEETLALVGKIIETGISALTVHCRTRSMRDRDAAMIERLKEIVDFVKASGKDIAVVENGDCKGYEDAKRIREMTGCDSVMIARAAESNPSCFSPTPLVDVEKTLYPAYIRVAKYVNNPWPLTKFCVGQFKGAHIETSKKGTVDLRTQISKANSYDKVEDIAGGWTGEEDYKEIVRIIESRPPRRPRFVSEEPAESAPANDSEAEAARTEKAGPVPTAELAENGTLFPLLNVARADLDPLHTPPNTQNPEPPSMGVPPTFPDPSTIPALSGRDAPTPTPGGDVGAP